MKIFPKRLLLMLAIMAIATPAIAARYSFDKAMKGARALMENGGPSDFIMLNVSKPVIKPAALLAGLRQARDRKELFAIGGPKLDWILDLLDSTIHSVPKERFDGVLLIVVAERADEKAVLTIVGDHGFSVRCGVFK